MRSEPIRGRLTALGQSTTGIPFVVKSGLERSLSCNLSQAGQMPDYLVSFLLIGHIVNAFWDVVDITTASN